MDTASIPAMQHLSDDDRQQLRATIRSEMSDALAKVTHEGNVIIPFFALIAVART